MVPMLIHDMTSGVVPLLFPAAMLLQVPDKQLERRKRAVEALADHSRMVLEQLRDAEDELLAGKEKGLV